VVEEAESSRNMAVFFAPVNRRPPMRVAPRGATGGEGPEPCASLHLRVAVLRDNRLRGPCVRLRVCVGGCGESVLQFVLEVVE